MFRKFLRVLAGAAALIALALAINTWRKGSQQPTVAPLAPLVLDESAAAERLAEAVRLRTITTRDDAALNADQFRALGELLARAFPGVHATLKREVIGDFALLFTWEGTDPTLPPILLMAHQDVVPVAPGTESDWQEPAFSGAIRDGYVWGRGAWDDKGNLMAQLEAIERLVADGFRPTRTVYLAYGADEEVSGQRGAAQIAALLKSRRVHLDFVLDEGLLVLEGVLAGVHQPTAVIGIAEKGYLSVALGTRSTPGHSSMPPPAGSSAIATMANALARLENRQMPTHLSGVVGQTFDALAPEMSGINRIVLSNRWLFGPLVERQLAASPGTNAMLRTTTALTIVNAGNKENVLPGRAEATVNFRILPGETTDDVLAHVRDVVGDLPGPVEVKALPGGINPSKVAPTDGVEYAALTRTIREVFPDALVAPGLLVGATDSAHYGEVCDRIYKFSPIRANAADLSRFHGTNERLSVHNYAEAIRFYHRLVERLAGASTDTPHQAP